MEITREIEEKSKYFDGKPEEGWELIGIKQNQRCNIYYYQDRQGNYHHTSVRRKNTYKVFETRVRKKDGIEYGQVVHKKTGQPIFR